MRKLIFAAACLLLSATPALADWETTRWGMTPEQVIAAVPGAVATAPALGTDVKGMHQLARAPFADGGIAMTASFLFDSSGLAFVGVTLEDVTQCDAYRKLLVARLGAGKPMERVMADVTLGKLEWVDPALHDRLMFSYIRRADQSYAICKFIAEKP